DYAKGIPMHVLLESVFVPSISTKTIQSQISIPYDWAPQNTYQRTPGIESTFSIVVNGVAVIDMREIFYENFAIRLEMPPTTRLPVSRDDIIIDERNWETYSSELRYLYITAANLGDITTMDR